MKKETDKILARDVADYLTNTGKFYEQLAMLRKNYSKKIAKGIFNRELAIKGIANHVYSYCRLEPTFKSDYSDYKSLAMSPATRSLIAEYILDDYMEEITGGL